MGRPDRDVERFGDLFEGEVEQMVEDHDGALLDRQAPEPALELVAIDHRGVAVGGTRLVRGPILQVGQPARYPSRLGVAGADDEAVRPGLEATRVAEPREIAPDREERLLGRVLRVMDIAQDGVRDRVQSIDGGCREPLEGEPVSALGPNHETGIHLRLPDERRGTATLLQGMCLGKG